MKTQKHKILMAFKWLFFGLSITLVSCAEMKDSAENAADNVANIWKGKQTLTVTFQKDIPYCGGAAPTKEQEAGITEPLANQVFYVYKDERPKSLKDMIRLTTNEKGVLSIDLKDGKYSIISEDKALSLDEFIKKKKVDDQFFEYSEDSCFETWRTTPDFTIQLAHPTKEVVTISHKCFTGDNPCMTYTGPYPP